MLSSETHSRTAKMSRKAASPVSLFLASRLLNSPDIPVLDPLAAHTSPGCALIDLSSTATHYDLRAVALEAFARPLWGLTSLLLGGGTYGGLDRWVRGLANGTDPVGEEYWGGAKAKDQRMVEMSPLSFAIAMAPERFFDVSTSNPLLE